MASVCDIATEDSARNAARFLHSNGLIYNVESNERNARRVILEPRYLALFTGSFLKNGRDVIQDGVIRARNLKQYVKGPMFPETLHNFLLTFLEKNGLAFKYINYNTSKSSPSKTNTPADAPSSPATPPASGDDAVIPSPSKPTMSLWGKAKAASLAEKPTIQSVTQQLIVANSLPDSWALWVPLLLPAEPPAELEKCWPEKHVKGGLQFGRRYHIPLNSELFFWRVMVRLLHFCPRDIYWRYGVLIEHQLQAESGGQILVTFKPELKVVDVWIRAVDKLSTIYRHVFETLETIKRTTPKINITTLVPCMHCVVNGIEPVYYFPMEVCEKAAMKAKGTT